ncbi:plastocyanin/azurin family copper-binding protein [Haladaptatus pallidirubidus]|uniref:Blue (type 1) copper domain-containing protein n=1 Tax=Haladaptatus pallidirubidus TaxID=1008152 RepID=A0AAV3ULP3_9EURY
MTDRLVFEPESVTVAPGTTVVWDNVGSVGHSITAYEDEIPEDAEYVASGDFDSEQAARDAYPEGDIGGGEQYEHTFDVEGNYEYFCIPHESAGWSESSKSVRMASRVVAGALPLVPNSAMTMGIATISAMVTVLLLAYFFLKYGDGYGLD